MSIRLTGDSTLARITLARPECLNVLDLPMLRALERALHDAEAKHPRAIVIDGEGPAFCAGGDLRNGATLGDLATQFHAVMQIIDRSPAVIVTLVRGVAAGGGVALAIAGDVRIGTPAARFRLGYGRVGLCVDGGISWRLPRLIGLAQAQRLFFEDPDVDAREAIHLGLLHRVVDPGAVEETLEALVARLELQSPGAVGRNKALLTAALTSPLHEALAREQSAMVERVASIDGRAGIAAFLEKRAPKFRGSAP